MEMCLNHVSATESGDYFQVLFEEEEDSDKAYFLIQRQFEFSDGGRFYIESHDTKLRGHFRIKRAELRRNRFSLELLSKAGGKLQIKFDTDEDKFEEAKRVLKIMFPRKTLEILDEQHGSIIDT